MNIVGQWRDDGNLRGNCISQSEAGSFRWRRDDLNGAYHTATSTMPARLVTMSQEMLATKHATLCELRKAARASKLAGNR
jgi:hypothetical protein